MADNKKVESSKAEAKSDETPKTTASKDPNDTATSSQAPSGAEGSDRTPVDQPSETVKVPTVDEVKVGAEIKSASGTQKKDQPTPQQMLEKHVDDVAKSAKAFNESNEKVAKAEPFVKPKVETRKAPTAEERLAQNVEAVAQSAKAYNESSKAEEQSTPDDIAKREKLAIAASKEESRLAPLTGELRPDPENDSYVTPGKVLAPKEKTGADNLPEIERAPLVISPLTGEIKPADEISYPTPGHIRDPSIAHKALDKNREHFMLEGTGKTKFDVPPGHQVSLLQANEEHWKNQEAQREDQKERAQQLAEMMVSGDGLRRTRRAQKNLR